MKFFVIEYREQGRSDCYRCYTYVLPSAFATFARAETALFELFLSRGDVKVS
jgi:hypothetical protein